MYLTYTSFSLITHPGQDRSPISCHHHSCQWYRTTTCHLLAPHLCRSHTFFPETQTGSGKSLPLNFHQLQQCLSKQRHNKNSKKQTNVATLYSVYVLWFLPLTTTGTESIFLIIVKVVCGGTPAVAITAALCGTAVIFLPLKDEGEDALSSIGVSSKCVQNCEGENWGQG